MNKQDINFNFKGQKIFLGIDVHKKTWHIASCTSHTNPSPWKQTIKKPFIENLKRYTDKHFPGAELYGAYEAGFCGFWVQMGMEKAGIRTIVVNPADIPTSDKERKHKTDKRDARKIARCLRNQELKAIYVPSDQVLQDRDLVRERFSIVKCGRRVKCQIKSHLALYGIEIPEEKLCGHWSNKYIEWLEETAEILSNRTLNLLLVRLNHIRSLQLRANRELRKLAVSERYRSLYQRLITVPGVGLLTAMQLMTELIDISRFKNISKINSYLGFIPTTSNSGESELTGRLTPRRNVRLRTALIESSWVAINRDPALLLKYVELKKRMTGQQAIVRIARILLRRIVYVWRSGQPYILAR